MMKYRRAAAVLLSCLMLAGCSADGKNSAREPGSGSDDTKSSAAAKSSTGGDTDMNGKEIPSAGDIPMLSIVSKTGTNDFITEPVAGHVTRSRRSWDPGFGAHPEPYYEDCTVSLTDTDSSVLIDGAEAQVKVRGNWTTAYPKKPLRIKFAKKQSALGLNDGAEAKNWVLLACYKDLSMLRDKTALQIGREILGGDGYYCADSEPVELTVNGEYMGVYLLTEQQQVNPARVDITEPEKDYTGTDIGYFMEYDGYFTEEEELNQFYLTYDGNAPLIPYDGKGGSGKTVTPLLGTNDDVGITIKSDIYSKEQHDFIASYMNNVYTIMYEAAYNDKAYVFNSSYTEISESSELTPQQAVEQAVDVRSLIDSYILCEIACDADLYWSSFFMDVDLGEGGSKKLTFEAPWDFDSALGNKDRCADGKGFYAANILTDVNDRYTTVNPWLTVLMYEDWYQEELRQRWTEVYDSGVFERAQQTISDDTDRLEAAFGRNYDRWDNFRDPDVTNEMCSRSAACTTQREAAEYFSEWLDTRTEFLNGEWHK